jgi:hypothetical protein
MSSETQYVGKRGELLQEPSWRDGQRESKREAQDS